MSGIRAPEDRLANLLVGLVTWFWAFRGKGVGIGFGIGIVGRRRIFGIFVWAFVRCDFEWSVF